MHIEQKSNNSILNELKLTITNGHYKGSSLMLYYYPNENERNRYVLSLDNSYTCEKNHFIIVTKLDKLEWQINEEEFTYLLKEKQIENIDNNDFVIISTLSYDDNNWREVSDLRIIKSYCNIVKPSINHINYYNEKINPIKMDKKEWDLLYSFKMLLDYYS